MIIVLCILTSGQQGLVEVDRRKGHVKFVHMENYGTSRFSGSISLRLISNNEPNQVYRKKVYNLLLQYSFLS
jgi:hypothetical protein